METKKKELYYYVITISHFQKLNLDSQLLEEMFFFQTAYIQIKKDYAMLVL